MSFKKVEMDFGDGRILSFETGKLALQASGSVVVRFQDTVVLVAATVAPNPRQGIDFFPLLVDFEEKLYAAGKIPGGFFKREGKATEKATLTARLIDRPLRPLFPENFRNDVQIVATPFSVDQENAPDVLAVTAASCALMLSGIPFNGPVACVRVGKIGEKFIVNPVASQIQESELDLVIAGTKNKVLMLEAGANQVPDSVVMEAIKLGHAKIKELIALQEKLMKEAGVAKKEFEFYAPDPAIEKFVVSKAEKKIEAALNIKEKDKQKEALAKAEQELKAEIEEGKDEAVKSLVAKRPNDVKEVLAGIEKKVFRKMVAKDGKRPDGRKMDELRALSAETGLLPRTHGSGLFSRGETQVLTIATLGSTREEQRLDGLETKEETKRYMHHYNFPAFSVGEVKPMRGPGRREIGHGALAERALLPVIPSQEQFPYTIRLVSEVLGSNGSTSMASTCGSTLALMDAGVPILEPVAGISIGLVSDHGKEVLLTDIQGLEDHFGDMDFKVTGTKNGITAIQLDIKNDGLSLDLIKDAINQAKSARTIILDKIKQAIAAPRKELSQYAPRVTMIQIDPEKIGLVIGPGGKNIKRIIEETGAEINIEDDGKVYISSVDPAGAEQAKKAIEAMTYEPKLGDTFTGKVTRIMNFGAFVEFLPGKEGLVHISQLDTARVAKVEDVVNIGDEVKVKVVEVDDMGRFNLSRKACL
ncbi:MAG: polyribonucleotide nucleotidyltransferase [Candidatus Saganbacteria bacterium]|nr:polyribonucleotide nucleotidyltransferase [Candidatus Saganbacteria bacterium]